MQTMLVNDVNGNSVKSLVKLQNIYVAPIQDETTGAFSLIRKGMSTYQIMVECLESIKLDSTNKSSAIRTRKALIDLLPVDTGNETTNYQMCKEYLLAYVDEEVHDLLFDSEQLNNVLKSKRSAIKIDHSIGTNGTRLIKKEYSIPVVTLNKTKTNAKAVLESVQETTAKHKKDTFFNNVFGSKVMWRGIFLTFSENKEQTNTILKKYYVDNIFDADAFIADNTADVVKKLATSFSNILFPALEQRKNPATGKTEPFLPYSNLKRKSKTSCYYRNGEDYIFTLTAWTGDADTIANNFDHNYIPHTNVEEANNATSYVVTSSAKAEDIMKEDVAEDVDAEAVLEDNSAE